MCWRQLLSQASSVNTIARRGLALSEHASLLWPTRQIAFGTALAAGAFYMVLTGMHVPIRRSFLMACLLTLAILAGFEEISSNDLKRVVDVHLYGTIWMCRAVWPHMREAGSGRIVNTVSAGMLGTRYISIYGAAKGLGPTKPTAKGKQPAAKPPMCAQTATPASGPG